MDLWLTLRDGRTAPLVGVESIASIDTVGTSTLFTGASISSGSPNVTVSSTSGILPGSMVFGAGVPTGATVLSITSGTVFVMSANATASIGSLTVTVTAISDADLKLLTVNSGWYRDIFSADTNLAYSSGTPLNGTTLQVPTVSGITFTNPVVTPPSYSTGSIPGSVIGTLSSTTSDELAHAALRQATWYEALWAFTCTTDAVVGPTLTLYYRKYDVVGFCNVAPSL